jgi:nucleolar complex protein 2
MKTKKSIRKFASSGKLKQAIQARHKHQQVRKQIDGRKARKGGPGGKGRANGKASGPPKTTERSGDEEDEDVEMTQPRPAKKVGRKGGLESDDEKMPQEIEVCMTLVQAN